MKALVYLGKDKIQLEDRPVPNLEAPTDAVVKVLKASLCGTDLHVLKGNMPTVKPGHVMGHEGVGVVKEVGSTVELFKAGDHVIISCIMACLKCEYCRRGMYSHCLMGGWMLGNTIDGTQAEYVRIPHADGSLHHIPEGVDEEAALMLCDILPTSFEGGVLDGNIQPGNSVAIVGAGPVGMAALLTAHLYSPGDVIMVDRNEARLTMAKDLGATHTVTVRPDSQATAEEIKQLTERKKGVDTAIEAVGLPATFELCEQIIAPGGHIANVGVHSREATLYLDKLWADNVTIRTHVVDTYSIPRLIKCVQKGKLDPRKLVTHHFKLDQILEAYDVFENHSKTKALKVVIDV
ncbi:hypothetical protein WJX72_012332 [[Myrmecia] bisecta]|uniref:Alcohol dehydrogenase n=1 Tax=[Myrmecia] bisecta TaxID=41462 RepID=A0AAW1Q8T1_9CHLO